MQEPHMGTEIVDPALQEVLSPHANLRGAVGTGVGVVACCHNLPKRISR
jgi:hypothetical protein